jgi:hypothetical protein
MEVSRGFPEARNEGTKLFCAGEKTRFYFTLVREVSRYRQPAARGTLLMLAALVAERRVCNVATTMIFDNRRAIQ